MIPFPADRIHDEDAALDWWENECASWCDALEGHVSAAALIRSIVSSLRRIRSESQNAKLSVTQAARETGYSTKQIRRWLKEGKIKDVGEERAPRIRRGDILKHKKPTLPAHAPIRIMAAAQDIARSVATRRSSDG
ncbi:MAG TPA: helix-turn-helix domain-containing protein [Gemmatimonadaceae bacterium]|nr:helix-turn-helix domain-containing protein [Gemmatimonadaceae bacterium]